MPILPSGTECTLPSPLTLFLTGNAEVSLAFKVTKQGIELVEPRLIRLSSIRNRTFSAASTLLFELMQRGVYLVPQSRDAGPAALGMKVLSAFPAQPFTLRTDLFAFQRSSLPFQLTCLPCYLCFLASVLSLTA